MRTLFLVFCIVVAGCHAGKTVRSEKDTVKAIPSAGNDTAQDYDMFVRDSMTKAAYSEAFSYVKVHLNEPDYTHAWNESDNDDDVQTHIAYGHLFEQGRRHLHLRHSTGIWEFVIYDQVYEQEQDSFRLILSDTIHIPTFVKDSIGDVNGDKLNDYMYVTYSMSGCCVRDKWMVYLYDEKTGHFHKPLDFMNADFFPEEKVIRGVMYGHPGEVPLYKRKWKDTLTELVEYIYFDRANPKQFIRTKDFTWEPKGEILKAVPKEYHHIYGYDWFMYDK